MKKGIKDIIILYLLILQLIFPSYLMADNNEFNMNHFSSADLDQRHPTEDLGLLTKQYRIDFIYDNGERKEARRVSLLDLDLSLQKPSIFKAQEDLRFEYNEDTKELWIIFSEFNRTTRQKQDVMAHVFTDVELTSNVVVDSDLLVFATTEGIRATLMDRIVNCGFVEPVLVPLVSPTVSDLKQKVSFLKFISIEENLSNYIDDLTKRVYEKDLIVGVESEGSSSTSYTVLDRSAIILALRNQIIGTLFLSSFYLDRDNQQELVAQIESTLESDQEVISEFLKTNEEVVNNLSSDSLLVHALKNIASGNKLKSSLFLLQKDSSDQDLLTRYAALTRLKITVQDTANIDSLIREYEARTGTSADNAMKKEIIISYFNKKSHMLLEGEERNYDSNETWLEAVGSDILNSENVLEAAAVKERGVFQRILHSTAKVWGKLSKKLKYSLVTTSVVAAFVGTCSLVAPELAAPVLNLCSSVLHGIWDVLKSTTNIPVVSEITGPLVSGVSYMRQEGWATTGRVLLGLGVTLSLYPLSLILVKLCRLSSTKGETLWQTFFDFGVRFYAKLCYPLVKFAWDAFRQKNVYPALEVGLNPIFNPVSASKEEIEQKAQDTLTEYSKYQDVSFVTKVLAACIVADLSEVDARALLLAEAGVQVKAVAALLSTDSRNSSLDISAIENIIYTTLMELGDNKDLASRIDEEELDRYIQVYAEVKDKIQNSSEVKQGFFTRLYSNFKKTLSKQVVPYMLYGKQGLDFYNKYKNAVVSKTTANLAGSNYRNDYGYSAILYAGSAASKFAVGSLGNIEVLANQLGQVVIFGIQGGVDIETVSNSMLSGSYPLQENLYDRTQSFGETFKTMASNSKTLSSVGYLDTHAQYIANLATGFNIRFLADYIVRVPGLISTTIVATGAIMGIQEMLTTAFKCVILSTFFLIAKIGISTAFIGYAVIWPYVQLAQKKNRNDVDFNTNILNEAGNLISEGIRFKDIDQARKGALALKTVYMLANKAIPSQFDKPVSEFSFEDVEDFNLYTQKNVPVPTKINPVMDRILTVLVGTLISTALFTGVSDITYKLDLSVMDAVELLGYSILFLGITYGSLKTISWVIKHIFNKKVETVVDEKLLEKIDSNERVKISREDVIKIFDAIKATTSTSVTTTVVDPCTELFDKEQ